MKKIISICVALAAFAIAPSANAADMPIRGPQYKYAPAPAPVFNWTGIYVGAHVGYGWGDDVDGFLGGLQIGYNWQLSPNIVFGIEADITGTDMNGTPAGFPFHIDYTGTLRGRLGYAFDRTMIYGTGGLAYARVGSLGIHDSDTGYAIGAGVEWAVSNAWSMKAEYMYHDIANGFEFSTIKVGLNYRFGSY